MATFSGKKSLTQIDYLLTDSDVDNTARADVFGGAATVYCLFLEANAGTTYLRIWDKASVSVGSDAPDFIFKLTGNVNWLIADGMPFNNFSYAAVTTSGTAGSSHPADGTTIKLNSVVR